MAPGGATPTTEHRVVSVVAAASLLAFVGPVWQTTVDQSPRLATGFAVVFPILLVALAVALGAKHRRTLQRLDHVVMIIALLAAAMRVLPVLRRPYYVVDESVIMAKAVASVAAGHNPYAGDWTAEVARAPTLLFDGTNPGRFGYPPLSALLGGGLAHVTGTPRAPVALSFLALLATAAILYRLLPVPRRALLVLAVVTTSALPFLAASGYPTAVMLPLLVVACHRPARIGAGGALGTRGVVQAVALGLAAAAQQLAWFVVPFLLVAIWRARRGELDRGPAAAVVARVIGVGLAAFAVVDVPFVLAGPGLWLRGVLDPLRQHAFFNGPGLPTLSLRIVGGGGQLGYWSVVAIVVLLALVATVALWPRLLGAGVVILPFVALWASLRAQTIYYATALPLVLAAVGSARAVSDFADARPVRLGRVPRLVVPAAGAVIAVTLAVAALVSPAPLRIRVIAVDKQSGRLTSLRLLLTNRSDHAVSPHVTLGQGSKFTPFLRQVSGPRWLPAGRSAVLVFTPGPANRTIRGDREIVVVSDDPQTVSTTRMRRGHR